MSGLEMHYLVLINMLKQIIIMSHLIACCWNKIQQYEIKQGSSETWLEHSDFLQHDWWGQYIMCFYWSTATIMLIGTSGTTILETIYCNIILFFTVGIFAYILENIAQTIKSITRDSMEYKRNLETLNKYMRNNNLDYDSQVIVRQQLEFVYKSSQEININKQAVQVLEQLPDNLSTNIRNQINRSLIQKFTPLTRNFSQKIIEKTYENPLIISETSYVSQETIFKQNNPLQDNQIYIYLVLGGEVELYYTKKNQQEGAINEIHTLRTVKEGELFGVQSFFSGQIPTYSAKSSQFTNLCRIKRSGFINLLKYSYQEHQKFCYIQDQVLQHGFSKYFLVQCSICKRTSHSEENCNLVHYNPKRYQLCLIDRFQKTFLQARQRYFRDSEQSDLKRISAKIFIETNELLNQHFNYKYTEIANTNHLYYKKYIESQQKMEYISNSSDTQSSNDDEDFKLENHNSIFEFKGKSDLQGQGNSYQSNSATVSGKKQKVANFVKTKKNFNFLENAFQNSQAQLNDLKQNISVDQTSEDVNNRQREVSITKNNTISEINTTNQIQNLNQQIMNQNNSNNNHVSNYNQNNNNFQQSVGTLNDLNIKNTFNINNDGGSLLQNHASTMINNNMHYQMIEQLQNQNQSMKNESFLKQLSELMLYQIDKTNQVLKQQKKQKKELQYSDSFSNQNSQDQKKKKDGDKKQFSLHQLLQKQQKKTLIFKQNPINYKNKNQVSVNGNQRQSVAPNHQNDRVLSMNWQTIEDQFILNFDQQENFEVYYSQYNLSVITQKYQEKFQEKKEISKRNSVLYSRNQLLEQEKKKYFTTRINTNKKLSQKQITEDERKKFVTLMSNVQDPVRQNDKRKSIIFNNSNYMSNTFKFQ